MEIDNTVVLHDEILIYMQNNPNAADSLKGIMEYWLPPEYGKVGGKVVEQALEQLIDEGVIRKTPLADGEVLYRQGNKVTSCGG